MAEGILRSGAGEDAGCGKVAGMAQLTKSWTGHQSIVTVILRGGGAAAGEAAKGHVDRVGAAGAAFAGKGG